MGKIREELRQGEDQIIEQHAAVVFKTIGCRVYEDEDLILWSLSFLACEVEIVMLIQQKLQLLESVKCREQSISLINGFIINNNSI